MNNAGASTIATPAQPGRRRTLLVLGIAGAAVVILAAVAAFMAMRMNSVPANLDYAATRLSENGVYRVSYSAAGERVPVNQLHTWTLHVETPDGRPVADAEVTVDGDMPQHGHGMPTRPQVTQNLGNGDYLVEGMKFQMGGWWVIDFTISAGGQTDRVSFNLMLNR